MRFYLTLIALVASFVVFAQPPQNFNTKPIKITGTVVDADNGNPLEYATLVLQSVKDPKMVTGGITNENGNFTVEANAGVYNISVEYISYKTYKKENQLLRTNTDLGTIALALDVEQLGEVEVMAERTSVELRLDKKIYNVGQDLTVSGGTVSDVLDNVPAVSVDVEGNVQLRGNDDVRILINGKPSALTGLNSTDALRQLPAESIEKVEVITSPSARYDAEGSAGIINIILRRSKLKGLNGALTANVGYPYQYGINGNLNYRVDNLNFFTNAGYNYREQPGNALNDTDFYEDGVFTNSLREALTYNRTRHRYNVNFGIEWYVNETASITQSIFIRNSDGLNTTTNNISQAFADGSSSTGLRITPEDEKDNTLQYSFNYDKQFNGDSQHKLSFDFQYELTDELEESLIEQDGEDSESIRTEEDQQRVFLQTDYVRPVGENGQFEIGYRGDFNQLDTDYDVVFISPTEEELGIPNPSNFLDYKESINAFYAQYGDKLGKVQMLAGLRYETTRLIINQIESNDFNRNNFDGWFPTLNLNYEVDENENFQLALNRRVQRPRSFLLNPFPSRTSPTNLFQGNPNLVPSFSGQIDLGYLKRYEKLTLNSSVYFSRATNVITFITEDTGLTTILDDEEVSVLQRTPVNLARNDRYGIDTNLNYRPSQKWNANVSFNLFNLITRGDYNDQNFDAENLSWFIRLNNKFTLPGSIDWQTRIFYRGPRENAQTKVKGIFSLNLAFSKDLFKERASLAFNVSDVFNSRKRRSDTFTEDFDTYSEFQWRERSFNITFTYRFNQKKGRQRGRGNYGGGDDFQG